jgi:ABC-type multidrug transport system permease subunit
MNLIKHIANILALWTIPYVIVLFFMLVTGFAFTYSEAVHSGVFIVLTSFYCIIIAVAYAVYDNENQRDNTFKLFKTK